MKINSHTKITDTKLLEEAIKKASRSGTRT
jgi:hypothetical protein